MNKHSENIFDLHLSSAESLEIAAEIIGFVHSRAESVLTVHMDQFDETNVSHLSPHDYLLLTELITVTEITLKTLLPVIDEKLLETFDKQLFCLDKFKERIGLKNLEKWKEEQTLKEKIQAKKMDDWIFEDYEEN